MRSDGCELRGERSDTGGVAVAERRERKERVTRRG